MKKLLVTLFILPAALSTANAAGSIEAGQAKAALCQSCHGEDGNAATPFWPSLAGQHASYIEKQLADFKNGHRNNETMAPMAMGLEKQDMADIAAYFASKKPVANSIDADEELISKGKKIYRGGNMFTKVPACAGCHSGNATGNPLSKYPRLRGQNAAYMAQQLEAFKSNARENDPNSMMRNIASRLTTGEIEAVTAYLNSLQ